MARPRRPEDEERRHGAASALLGFGALLLMPPFLNLFTHRSTLFGLPTEAVYLFGIWIALVAGAAWFARATTPKSEDTAKEDVELLGGNDEEPPTFAAKPAASPASGPGLNHIGALPRRSLMIPEETGPIAQSGEREATR